MLVIYLIGLITAAIALGYYMREDILDSFKNGDTAYDLVLEDFLLLVGLALLSVGLWLIILYFLLCDKDVINPRKTIWTFKKKK